MLKKYRASCIALGMLSLVDMSLAPAGEGPGALPSARRTANSQAQYYDQASPRLTGRSMLQAPSIESLPDALAAPGSSTRFDPSLRTTAPANSGYPRQVPYFGSPNYRGCRCGNTFYGEPLGQSVNGHMDLQIAAGQAAQMFLYDYDFRHDSADHAMLLNVHGQRQLVRFANWMTQTPMFPVTIEANLDNAALNEARRRVVMAELERLLGVPVSPEQVHVGLPSLPQLGGVEARQTYENLLQESRVGGISPRDLGPSARDGGTNRNSGNGSNGSTNR